MFGPQFVDGAFTYVVSDSAHVRVKGAQVVLDEADASRLILHWNREQATTFVGRHMRLLVCTSQNGPPYRRTNQAHFWSSGIRQLGGSKRKKWRKRTPSGEKGVVNAQLKGRMSGASLPAVRYVISLIVFKINK